MSDLTSKEKADRLRQLADLVDDMPHAVAWEVQRALREHADLVERPSEAIGLPETGVVHVLKCWPEYFAAVLDGSKPFEVRHDDRGFAVGDKLRLREWDYRTETYTGRETIRRVTYLTAWGQPEAQVVMGLGSAPVEPGGRT